MTAITKTQSHTYKVFIGKKVYLQIKTFKTKTEAQKWARLIESVMDRCLFVDRTEAEKTTVGKFIYRYIQEVTPLKREIRDARNEISGRSEIKSGTNRESRKENQVQVNIIQNCGGYL